MQRYFINQVIQSVGEQISVLKDQEHHMVKVMRMNIEECCEVVDEKEQLYIAKITQLSPFELTIEEHKEQQVELPINVTIFVGLSKGDKLETIVQKATELGVHTIVPVEMKRNMVKWTKDKSQKKIERLQKIAQEAAEQSHRLHVPKVLDLMSLKESVVLAKQSTKALVAFEEVAKEGEAAVFVQTLTSLQKGDSIAFYFGPEGGFDLQEIEYLNSQEVHSCALGPRILRAETAPMYALTAVSYHFELLKG
ncbi:16S rRNA (uracil(1498)-N(3))-methyltransferase [uncultured Granulicatella sp.]|uniref:16S rRNA (uracil(1498)-N(3))-methyltransferase n=1 Tax=uncultured Granulicatella sp. TaxID=316089 RepID=UPI0028D3B694|nr:16S rRNA (uracil(1498)-N(3))-methyltransferase [uncultured Granulicatella sp.]